MTTPHERTKALVDAREMLQTLYASEEAIMWTLVRTLAMMILRHYPRDEDVVESAAALPSLWSAPPPAKEAVPSRWHHNRLHTLGVDELNLGALPSGEPKSSCRCRAEVYRDES